MERTEREQKLLELLANYHKYYDESAGSVVVNGCHHDGAWRCLYCDTPAYYDQPDHTPDCIIGQALRDE